MPSVEFAGVAREHEQGGKGTSMHSRESRDREKNFANVVRDYF